MKTARLAAAVVAFAGLALVLCEPAAAAKMSRDQARIACRSEIPKIPKGDKGSSRGGGGGGGGNPAMRECVRAKMRGK